MELTLIELSLLIAFVFCILVELYFCLFVHLKLGTYVVEQISDTSSEPISVIICARNEADNLAQFLPEVLAQDYEKFEVIVVNDRSWDGTADLLKQLAEQYAHLKIVTVSEGDKFIAGKKFAVTMGIKASSYDWLVFTDADCKPESTNWLRGMQPVADTEKEIILGYSPYFKKASILNCVIRLETFFTGVNYLSFALKGNPYMGVGRNLAYRKSLFFKNKGFASHMHIPSGDDDLFVNANANARNTVIQINKDAQVWSNPKETFMSYLRQKKRHLGAGQLYKGKDRFILIFQIVNHLAMFGFGVAVVWFPKLLFIGLGLFGFVLLVKSLVYGRIFRRLNYGELRWWFPFLEILLLIFTVVNSFVSIFVKKVVWK